MSGNELIWAASDPFDLVFKLISGITGLVGFAFAIYVVFLKRKWKKDEEHRLDKEEKERLAFSQMVESVRSDLTPKIQSTAQMVSSLVEQLGRLETSQGDQAGRNDLTTLKYNIDNDLADFKHALMELKRDFSGFNTSCATRHDAMQSHGSLPDLKARVDELVRKMERLEDFRHDSADRYVLMVNYQQDVKLLTDAISVLRNDLRTVLEMVDKL